MNHNAILIAWRKLVKDKLVTGINVVGLAVGIAATLFLGQYLRQESSYDRFHQNYDRLYRISVLSKEKGTIAGDSYLFTPPIGPAMAEEFPEVEQFCRISDPQTAYLAAGERSFKIKDILHADSTFFDLFSFSLLAGDPAKALTAPWSIVLTEAVATRLFGDKNPLHQLVKMDNGQDYQVTGIITDAPENSHIRYSALVSFSTLYQLPDRYMDWNGGNQYISYIRLTEGVVPETVQGKFQPFMWRHINQALSDFNIRFDPYLQPMADIHLKHNPYSANLRFNLLVLGIIAVFILLIACINFINLSTARSAHRAKEIGVRKMLGATRFTLIRQFFGEAALMVVIAFVLALYLVRLLNPLSEILLGNPLMSVSFFSLPDLAVPVFVLLVTTLLAGGYPALFLSARPLLKSLEKNRVAASGGLNFRNMLVVFQFMISIGLMICTFTVARQRDFIRNKDLGFQREHILQLPLVGEVAQSNYAALKQELSQIPEIARITGSSEVPGNGFTRNGYIPEGMDSPMMIQVVDIDETFLETFQIELIQGRGFAHERATEKSGYLINETLARSLNWEDPIGKKIDRNGEHTVIGVIADFHFASLHDRIEPLILTNAPWRGLFQNLSLRINPGADLPKTLASIHQSWNRVLPQTPFEFSFLDETFNQIYQQERRFQQLFTGFSLLAVLIAAMGLFGLAAFIAEQRTKEIGIRKVLGASLNGIVGMMSKDFLKLVLIALALAAPPAWYFMDRWLENFAYRTQIPWWVFPASGFCALAIAFATVSYQSWNTARMNPAISLKAA